MKKTLKDKIINLFKKEPKKTQLDEVVELFERALDKYEEKVMLKAIISDNEHTLEIYSSNFKTTLNKAKKSKKEENETEERETATQ